MDGCRRMVLLPSTVQYNADEINVLICYLTNAGTEINLTLDIITL